MEFELKCVKTILIPDCSDQLLIFRYIMIKALIMPYEHYMWSTILITLKKIVDH